MSQKLDTSPAAIGIDIGKNSFHIVGQNQRGAIVLRQKWSRGQVEARLANLPPCLIGMEACVECPLASALPAPEQTDKVLQSPCRVETGSLFAHSLSTARSRLRMNGRFAPKAVVQRAALCCSRFPECLAQHDWPDLAARRSRF